MIGLSLPPRCERAKKWKCLKLDLKLNAPHFHALYYFPLIPRDLSFELAPLTWNTGTYPAGGNVECCLLSGMTDSAIPQDPLRPSVPSAGGRFWHRKHLRQQLCYTMEPSTSVMTMTAMDADDPNTDNAVLRYNIVRQSPDKPSPHMFYIDPDRGHILTGISPTLLDRETEANKSLQLQLAMCAPCVPTSLPHLPGVPLPSCAPQCRASKAS
ncbi:hypothetical protein ACEWY4_010419 [Coilia grayii]|uniref:Cadherin domain-containing protein n=1 Tax=Coilia grayii TaxID=363190 RepID=A0ABD1K1V9_9TELE